MGDDPGLVHGSVLRPGSDEVLRPGSDDERENSGCAIGEVMSFTYLSKD